MPGPVYEALELLGEGGVGRVYRALHHPSGIGVALKTLHGARARSEAYRLFAHEAAAAAQLRHENVVELYDFVLDEGRPYLVFELIDGYNIDRWLDEWPGWDTVADAFEQVLGGLSVAHAAGIIHRDLKPANLLFTRDGRVKITDFGMAEVKQPLEVDTDRPVGGTPLYMAPEQLEPHGHHGPWTDLYSLGVIAFVLFSGGDRIPASVDWRAAKRRPAPRLVPRPGLELSPELIQWVEALLEPSLAKRPRFAAHVLDSFRTFRHGARETVVGVSRGLAGLFAGASTVAMSSDLASASTIAFDSSSSELGSSGSWTGAEGASIAPGTELELPFTLPASDDPVSGASLIRLRQPPFAARDDERGHLLELVERVRSEKRVRVLTLLGEAGVGKSRLARWLLGEVERSGSMEATAAGYDPSGTSDGLRRALARLFGPAGAWSRSPPSPKAWDRWRLEEHVEDVPALRAWVEQSEEALRFHPTKVIDLAVGALVAAAAVHPLYLWLDDVAWARDGALEVVERLLELENVPILIVLTVRSGSAEHPRVRARLKTLRAHPRAEEREVVRMDLAGRAALLAEMAPLAPATSEALARCLDETPLVLVQLVSDLLDSKALVPGPDGYRAPEGRGLSEIVAERSIGRLLAERVGKLISSFGDRASEAESVLIRASLLGQRFDERALWQAARPDIRRRFVQAVIGRSLLYGLLRAEPKSSYRFEHDLLRKAARERIEGRLDRIELLTVTARAILEVHGRTRPEVRTRAALLFREAGALDDALELVFASVHDYGLMSSIAVAEDHRTMAREWIELADTPGRRARLHYATGILRYYSLRYSEGLEELDPPFAWPRRPATKCWRRNASLASPASISTRDDCSRPRRWQRPLWKLVGLMSPTWPTRDFTRRIAWRRCPGCGVTGIGQSSSSGARWSSRTRSKSTNTSTT